MSWVDDYIKECGALQKSGDATELSYRPAIKNMLNAAAKDGNRAVNVLHEPKRIHPVGAPDFRITAKSGGVVGYVECKKAGENLAAVQDGEQMKKYGALSDNFMLTDSLRWWLLRNGAVAEKIELSQKMDDGAKENFARLLDVFLGGEPERIGDTKRLAKSLAVRCGMLRDNLTKQIACDAGGKLTALLDAFKEYIYAELSDEKFADTFAQTLVYSLLLAKLESPAGQKLDLYNAEKYIPRSAALISEITAFLKELEKEPYTRAGWIVKDILDIINAMDAAAVLKKMSYKKGVIDGDDPYINFYENFLAAYDAKLRKSRGVYYTPPPVARFIVRAVDDILRDKFGKKQGLADRKVTALDFAAGTGTFLLEMMRTVLSDKSPARRDILKREHILKNFHGFEFMIAPYIIAHIKLAKFLKDSGAALSDDGDEKLSIVLTNTLEKILPQADLPFLRELAAESKKAQKIKDMPILVITGNPPYSVHSQNKGEWIKKLLRGVDASNGRGETPCENYYELDGKPLGERNPKALQDDYVKFIRFAQWKMENVERGVVAVITNHGFLDNLTFRGMRESLMSTFNQLYFLDLHGNARRGAKTPDGDKDENIFDIMQGIAVSLMIKNPDLPKGVFHADLWGRRRAKYAACEAGAVEWKKLNPSSPLYLFVPQDAKAAKRYEKLPSLTDVFDLHGVGVTTGKDEVYIHFAENEMRAAIKKSGVEYDSSLAKKIAYRPFDERLLYNNVNLIERPRKNTMRHMLAEENIGLISVRQVAEKEFNHAFVADGVIEGRMTLSNKGAGYLFPLYLYERGLENGDAAPEKRENFNPKFRKWIDARYGKKHAPEKILNCIYAVLHSPTYRRDYGEFLRLDFPRIPFPADDKEFLRLAKIGGQLIDAHLLRAHCDGDLAQLQGDTYKNHLMEKIRYAEAGGGRLFFNKSEYFAPLPAEVFGFQIGGYLPLDKFLKSRRGRCLSLAESDIFAKAANAVAFTIRKMREID